MEENKELEKKSSKAPLIILLILLFLIAALGSSVGGYFFGKKDINKVIKEKNAECKKKVKEARKDEASKCNPGTCDPCEECKPCDPCEPVKPKCYGTYTQDGTNGKSKWILNDDGTYTIESQNTKGSFVIIDNTITFIKQKDTSSDKDPHYENPKTYLISDDCKTITLSTGKIASKLTKQD